MGIWPTNRRIYYVLQGDLHIWSPFISTGIFYVPSRTISRAEIQQKKFCEHNKSQFLSLFRIFHPTSRSKCGLAYFSDLSHGNGYLKVLDRCYLLHEFLPSVHYNAEDRSFQSQSALECWNNLFRAYFSAVCLCNSGL